MWLCGSFHDEWESISMLTFRRTKSCIRYGSRCRSTTAIQPTSALTIEGMEHTFVKFNVLDIEKSPELLHSQQIVVATNCVHATHRLVNSTKNIHDILRPDGMLMITETLP